MESSLTQKKSDYYQKVGIYLGWGDGVTKPWPDDKLARLKDAVDAGYTRFITNDGNHDWSFLRPVVSVTLANGTQSCDLPEDYGALDGTITATQSTTSSIWPVLVTGEGRIREMYARLPQATGRPVWAAEVPQKGVGLLSSSRYKLAIYPQADDNFTLQFAYYLLPDCLTDSHPYAYGGMQHSQTILESCLAVAEERIDDISGGLHAQRYAERLAASMAIDRRNKAQVVGYNADRSDARNVGYWPWREKYLTEQITYYGSVPG